MIEIIYTAFDKMHTAKFDASTTILEVHSTLSDICYTYSIKQINFI